MDRQTYRLIQGLIRHSCKQFVLNILDIPPGNVYIFLNQCHIYLQKKITSALLNLLSKA